MSESDRLSKSASFVLARVAETTRPFSSDWPVPADSVVSQWHVSLTAQTNI